MTGTFLEGVDLSKAVLGGTQLPGATAQEP
ncbi:hypothetical protein [Streptomyces sp. NPDC051662]